MKIPFYILGLLLRFGPQHGYRLKQIIEEEISDFAKIKLPTIYYHLEQLKENGYVTETVGRDGNRPEKMVYQITEKGRKHFDQLLVKQLQESYAPEFSLDGILYFKERTDPNQILVELENKIQEIQTKLKTLERHKLNALSVSNEQSRFCIEAIFEHHKLHLEAELAWLKKVNEGLVK